MFTWWTNLKNLIFSKKFTPIESTPIDFKGYPYVVLKGGRNPSERYARYGKIIFENKGEDGLEYHRCRTREEARAFAFCCIEHGYMSIILTPKEQ